MSTYIFETDEERFARCHQDARGYHRRAVLFAEQQQSPSLVFNVAAIAVENYLIALCARQGNMPFNHNYAGLLAAVTEQMPLPAALCDGIRHLDGIFGICSVDNYHHGTPGIADKEAILTICNALSALLATEE
ncbi:hypothetical protein Bresa_00757|uniref:HEPN domain-containing protein n=1 Tax=Brenneria salicis ATCC 15712 = DSM 30166 TaxID=714314 RepID=A0A366IA49_9GAMM|nr:hypothetical protein [Brenneria salicis]NMN90672.1 hypothetical protein [Brenneria salicis ATCC 15712 = DSM 30166]RBP66832.1 hypothetical protein DES54_10240 [Brenneria salicis ATCC 15712 = DSM 30166]RLM32184.1 hypothetical protein BHG07_02075 [Brenneria salicis ATCC 15712 = DSM 30166]